MLAHTVGDKDVITKDFAAYTISIGLGGLWGKICNWRIDFDYYDVKGKKYRTIKGPLNKSCVIGKSVMVNPGKVKYGRACAARYVQGKKRGEQCHAVTK